MNFKSPIAINPVDGVSVAIVIIGICQAWA